MMARSPLLILFLTFATAAAPKANRVDPPRAVLFIGNSFSYYNNSIHAHLRELVNATDPSHTKDYTFKSMTISGADLEEHRGNVPLVVKSRKWDMVVLQGQSTEPMAKDKERSERFRAAAREDEAIIRASGARTAFFMTWAYQGKPEMTAPLAEGYESIGNELGALVVPVGLAFERSLKSRPELVLHAKDHLHPSLAGTYLAACTFYAALYGRSAEGSTYTADLDPDTAKYLQGIAWQTVQAYYGAAK